MVAHRAGNGGSQPTYADRASYVLGASTSIANGASADIPFGSLGSGEALLDLTDSALPLVLAEGIYAATVTVQCIDTMTAGGVFMAILHLDPENADAVATNQAFAVPPGTDFSTLSLAVSYYVPVGGALKVRVFNYDGAASRHFQLNELILQRLS